MVVVQYYETALSVLCVVPVFVA